METNVKNINGKRIAFNVVKAITGTTHLMSTAIANASVNTEATIGNKLGQGTKEDLKQNRIAISQERLDKVNTLASDWMSKFEEAKAKRQLNTETK